MRLSVSLFSAFAVLLTTFEQAGAIDACKRQPFRGRCPSVNGEAPRRSQFVLRYYLRNGECVSYPYGHCATDPNEPQLHRYKEECEDACISNAPANLGTPKDQSDEDSPKDVNKEVSRVKFYTKKVEKTTVATTEAEPFESNDVFDSDDSLVSQAATTTTEAPKIGTETSTKIVTTTATLEKIEPFTMVDVSLEPKSSTTEAYTTVAVENQEDSTTPALSTETTTTPEASTTVSTSQSTIEETTTRDYTSEASSTKAPTTEEPTTTARTTKSSTTEAPTTESTTTGTEPPTTHETLNKITRIATTENTATEASTTEASTTEASTTEASTTEASTTAAHTTKHPRITTIKSTTQNPPKTSPTTTIMPTTTETQSTSNAPISECQRRRAQAYTSSIQGGFVPVCKSNGEFDSVQCEPTGGQCFCVDRNGIETPNSRVSNGKRPDCKAMQSTKTSFAKECVGAPMAGPCTDSMARFFYNEESQSCEEFNYTGCGGNGNNYETKEQCEERCAPPPVGLAQCEIGEPLKTKIGVPVNCANTDCPSGYKCSIVQHSSVCCPENNNELGLQTSVPNLRCALPKERGPCDKYELRFYYNSDLKECKYFFWGGCKGNENNFERVEDCENACGIRRSGSSRVTNRPNTEIRTTQGIRITPNGWRNTEEEAEETSVSTTSTVVQTTPVRTTPTTTPTTTTSRSVSTVRTNNEAVDSDEEDVEEDDDEFTSSNIHVKVTEPTPVLLGVNRCEHPRDPGNCRGQFVRWFFDPERKTCDVFTYTGCQGNGNNFASREECMAICHKPEVTTSSVPDFNQICMNDVDAGECNGVFERFAFDVDSGDCRSFTYGGCGGNGNNFASMQECRQRCVKSEVLNVCESDIDVGECSGVFHRFAFDKTINDCRKFTYGGCGGNGNNFATVQECRNKCVNRVCPETPSCDLTRCQLVNDRSGCPFCSCPPVKQPIPPTPACPPVEKSKCREPCIIFSNRRGCDECVCPSASTQAPVVEAHPPAPQHVEPLPPAPRAEPGPPAPTTIAPPASQRPQQSLVPRQFEQDIEDKCLQPMEAGPCTNFADRWYFNSEDGTCHPFKYGGCAGNRNHFFTQKECEVHCARFLGGASSSTDKPKQHAVTSHSTDKPISVYSSTKIDSFAPIEPSNNLVGLSPPVHPTYFTYNGQDKGQKLRQFGISNNPIVDNASNLKVIEGLEKLKEQLQDKQDLNHSYRGGVKSENQNDLIPSHREHMAEVLGTTRSQSRQEDIIKKRIEVSSPKLAEIPETISNSQKINEVTSRMLQNEQKIPQRGFEQGFEANKINRRMEVPNNQGNPRGTVENRYKASNSPINSDRFSQHELTRVVEDSLKTLANPQEVVKTPLETDNSQKVMKQDVRDDRNGRVEQSFQVPLSQINSWQQQQGAIESRILPKNPTKNMSNQPRVSPNQYIPNKPRSELPISDENSNNQRNIPSFEQNSQKRDEYNSKEKILNEHRQRFESAMSQFQVNNDDSQHPHQRFIAPSVSTHSPIIRDPSRIEQNGLLFHKRPELKIEKIDKVTLPTPPPRFNFDPSRYTFYNGDYYGPTIPGIRINQTNEEREAMEEFHKLSKSFREQAEKIIQKQAQLEVLSETKLPTGSFVVGKIRGNNENAPRTHGIPLKPMAPLDLPHFEQHSEGSDSKEEEDDDDSAAITTTTRKAPLYLATTIVSRIPLRTTTSTEAPTSTTTEARQEVIREIDEENVVSQQFDLDDLEKRKSNDGSGDSTEDDDDDEEEEEEQLPTTTVAVRKLNIRPMRVDTTSTTRKTTDADFSQESSEELVQESTTSSHKRTQESSEKPTTAIFHETTSNTTRISETTEHPIITITPEPHETSTIVQENTKEFTTTPRSTQGTTTAKTVTKGITKTTTMSLASEESEFAFNSDEDENTEIVETPDPARAAGSKTLAAAKAVETEKIVKTTNEIRHPVQSINIDQGLVAQTTEPTTLVPSTHPTTAHPVPTSTQFEPRLDSRVVCVLPPDAGTCNNYVPRWFFNSQTGQCEQFAFGNCGGNANNFIDRAQCERKCMSHHVLLNQVPERCSINKDAGSGNGYNVKWYFNMKNLRCEQFVYEGRGGNDNKFETLSECELTCTPSSAKPLPHQIETTLPSVESPTESEEDYEDEDPIVLPNINALPVVPTANVALQDKNVEIRPVAPIAPIATSTEAPHYTTTVASTTPTTTTTNTAPTTTSRAAPVSTTTTSTTTTTTVTTTTTRAPPATTRASRVISANHEATLPVGPEPRIIVPAPSNILPDISEEAPLPPSSEPRPPSANAAKTLAIDPIGVKEKKTYAAKPVKSEEDKFPTANDGQPIVGASPKQTINYQTGEVHQPKANGIRNFVDEKIPTQRLFTKKPSGLPSCANGQQEVRYNDGRPVMCLPGKNQCPSGSSCYFNGLDFFCCPDQEDPYDKHAFGGYGGEEARNGYKVFGELNIRRLMDDVPLRRAKRQAQFNIDSVVAALRFDEEKPHTVHRALHMKPTPVLRHGANPLCIEPVVKGSCNEAHLRYYYDRLSDSCRLFEYSGCEGNANNFGSLDDCQRLCVLDVKKIKNAAEVKEQEFLDKNEQEEEKLAPGQCPGGKTPLGGSAPVLCGNSTESIGCPSSYYCRSGPPDVCCPGPDPKKAVVEELVDTNRGIVKDESHMPRGFNRQIFLSTPKYMCPDAADPLMLENGEPMLCGSGFDGVQMCPKGYYCAIDSAKNSRLCCPLFGDAQRIASEDMFAHKLSATEKPNNEEEEEEEEEENDDEDSTIEGPLAHLQMKAQKPVNQVEKLAKESPLSTDVNAEAPVAIDIGEEKPNMEEVMTSTSKMVIQDKSVCQIKPSEGRVCNDDETPSRTNLQYFYSPRDKKCKLFFFRGCGGNLNRFEKKSDCEALCY